MKDSTNNIIELHLPLAEFVVKRINGQRYVRVRDVKQFVRETCSGVVSTKVYNNIARNKYATEDLFWTAERKACAVPVMKVVDTNIDPCVSVKIIFE